jgi:hypothetical protein
MAHIKQGIRIIGGSQPNFIVDILKGGVPIPRSEMKKYSVRIYTARHEDNWITDPKGGYHAVGYYDRAIRRFRIVIPKSVTQEQNGNYIYHIQILSPDGTELRRFAGHYNVVQGIVEITEKE